MYRFIPTAVVLIGAILISSVPPGGGQESPILNVAFHPNYFGAPITALGLEKGFFKQAGIAVKPHRFTFAGPQNNAMAAGKLDIGFLGTGGSFFAFQGKATIIAIDAVGFTEEILAAPGSGVTSLPKMKGQKVMVVEGTSSEMVLRLGLKKAGLRPSDVEMIFASPENSLSAFIAGRAPLLALWQPMSTQAIKANPEAKVLLNVREFYPDVVFPGLWVVHNDFLARHPDQVKRFLGALKQAADFRAKNPEETIAIVSKFTEVPPEILRTQLAGGKWLTAAELETAFRDGSVDRWLTRIGEMFVEMGRLKEVPKLETFFVKDLFLEAR